MQVAKYWRNKQLRYRLARGKRVRASEASTVDKERVPPAAINKRDEKPVAAGLIA